MPDANKATMLSRETLVPLGVVVAVALTAAGAGAAWKGQFADIDNSFQQVNRRLDAIEHGVADRWTRTNTLRLLRELKLLNPTLQLPEAQSY